MHSRTQRLKLLSAASNLTQSALCSQADSNSVYNDNSCKNNCHLTKLNSFASLFQRKI